MTTTRTDNTDLEALQREVQTLREQVARLENIEKISEILRWEQESLRARAKIIADATLINAMEKQIQTFKYREQEFIQKQMELQEAANKANQLKCSLESLAQPIDSATPLEQQINALNTQRQRDLLSYNLLGEKYQALQDRINDTIRSNSFLKFALSERDSLIAKLQGKNKKLQHTVSSQSTSGTVLRMMSEAKAQQHRATSAPTPTLNDLVAAATASTTTTSVSAASNTVEFFAPAPNKPKKKRAKVNPLHGEIILVDPTKPDEKDKLEKVDTRNILNTVERSKRKRGP